jgi:hypothetical protein
MEGINPEVMGSGKSSPRRRSAGSELVAASSLDVAAKPKRGGGPKTPEGKRASSRNATRHGIYSGDTVIGDERFEDWQVCLSGYRQSLQPQGAFEEDLVEQVARNRWKRGRLERYVTERLNQQIELTRIRPRDALERDYDTIN